MIKGVIMDVDGVIVGKKEGVNFPLPHADATHALKTLAAHGIPVVLCTAKFHVAIDGIIQQAKLNNPHITDGGALIINPLGDQKIIEQVTIDRAVIKDYLAHDDTYTELYSADNYYVAKDADPEFRAKRSQLLQMEPTVVSSLDDVTASIIKIISYANDEADMPRVEAQAKRLGHQISYFWSHHPFIMPCRPCVMTAPGVSKQHAAERVAEYLGISLTDMLGIGDSPADWSFMQLCGYVGMVGGNAELKALVSARGDKGYVGGSVDDHGILDIFDYFWFR